MMEPEVSEGRALWEANGPALGRVFGDLIRDKLPVIARSEATRRSHKLG
jgi:hypothetical protein